MFERYNEAARRMLFFTRCEATQLGAIAVETEHLLLGLLREPAGASGRVLELAKVTPERVRADVEHQMPARAKVSTSVEIPFSAETKRVIEFAADEANRMHHAHIGTEHLLLGMIQEEESVAGALLKGYGIDLATARKLISDVVGDGGLET